MTLPTITTNQSDTQEAPIVQAIAALHIQPPIPVAVPIVQAIAALQIQPPLPAHHFHQAAPTTPENQGTNANRERDRDLRQGRQTANRAPNITPRSLF